MFIATINVNRPVPTATQRKVPAMLRATVRRFRAARNAQAESQDVACYWKQIDRAVAATSDAMGGIDRICSRAAMNAEKRDRHYIYAGLVFC